MVNVELVIVTALILFAVTHVDTLVVLIAFFADTRYHQHEVVTGHILGFAIGLSVPIAIALVAPEPLRHWGFLFGIVPLGLGLWGFFRREGAEDTTHPPEVLDGFSRLAIVTVAGIGLSGENIAVYVPFFITLSSFELGIITVLYGCGALALLVVARYLSQHPGTAHVPTWIEERLVPATLTLVGCYVLVTGWIALG